MVYGYLNNGEIESVGQLPKSWKNVSNIYLLSESELNNLGWYKVDMFDLSTLEDWQIVIGAPSYSFDEENKIILESYVIEDKDLTEYKIEKITALKTNTFWYVDKILPTWVRENANVSIALGGVDSPYTLTKAKNILSYTMLVKAKVDEIEQEIINAISHEEVNEAVSVIDYIDYIGVE